MPPNDPFAFLDSQPQAPTAGTAAPTPAQPTSTPSSAAALSKAFDDIDTAKANEHDATPLSVAEHYAAGINSHAVANTLSMVTGIPTDLVNAIIGKPFDPQWKLMSNPLPAEWWDKQLGKIGIGEQAANVANPTPSEQTARRVGEVTGDVLQTLLPAKAGLAGAAAKGVAAAPLTEMFGAGSVPGNMALAGATALGGEAGKQLAPAGYEQVGQELGELGGGIAGAGTGALTRKTGRAISAALPPLTKSGREAAAQAGAANTARTISGQGSALESQIEQAVPGSELVPGSIRTTGEIINNPGLLAAQRTQERTSNVPMSRYGGMLMGNVLAERRAANTDARMAVLESQAPVTASPVDVKTALQQHLNDIDNTGDAEVAAERAKAQTAASATMPTMSPEEQGQAARGAIEAERAPTTAALQQQAEAAQAGVNEATNAFGGQEAQTPEARAVAISNIGTQIRDPVVAAYTAERQRLSKLRAAIDPTGQMGMSPGPIQDAVAQIEQTFAPSRGLFSGVEKNLYQQVGDLGDTIPIETAFGLRADINARLRRPDLEPREELRLSVLKQGVDQAINEAASQIGNAEASGTIHSGILPIEQRIQALAPTTGSEAQSAADVAAARTVPNPTSRGNEAGSEVPPTANQQAQPIREGTVSTEGGSGGTPNGGPRSAAGAEDIPPSPDEVAAAAQRTREQWGLAPPTETAPELVPMTPEARQRFADWNAQYRQMGQTFRGETPGQLHAVGKITQKGGAYDSYKLAPSEVPWLFLNGGKTEGDAVSRLLTAAPEAQPALEDAYSFSLRSAAQKPDGSLDLSKYNTWLQKHAGAMQQLPDVFSRFGTAAEAQQRLNDITQSLKEHAESHPLAPGLGDAAILPRFVKPGSQGGEQMTRFLEMSGNRPEAIQAATDYFSWLFANQAIKDGVVNVGKANSLLKQYKPMLDAIPGAADRFADAATAQKSVEDTIAQHQQMRDEFTKSVAGAFLQDDPERAVSRLFQGNSRDQNAQKLMNLVKDDPAATEGVRRATIDMIRKQFEGAAVAGSEVGGLKPNAFGKFVENNRNVLATVFPRTHVIFDWIAEDLESSTRSTAARAPGGSDTAEILARSGHAPTEQTHGMSPLLAGLLGERAMELMMGHVGSVVGPIGALAGVAANKMLGHARSALQIRQEEIFNQILLDPQTAVDVLKANPLKAPKPTILRTLQGRLVQQALESARGDGLQPAH